MSKLPEKYDAKTREKFWQQHWREKKIYQWRDDKPKSETFVIDTPPPTVSGLLHMGHVFSYTQADFVARYQRMQGKDVFYPMGFDDNGLPTERLVEKIIGKKAAVYESENGRGSFVSKCREVVEEAEKEFEAMFNEIALSVDWAQKYQTISPESQKISQASFVDLYRKGLVEKKFEPVFWDISDRTALAQADLVDKEVEGVMNYIEFEVDYPSSALRAPSPTRGEGDKLKSSFDAQSDSSTPSPLVGEGARRADEGYDNDTITIMTTRPELLPACVAVMVHPDDERYKHLHGQTAITPLFGVKVPIIADELVQLDKGTGAVMCCTFGDETDIRWTKKHRLPLRVMISPIGKMCDCAQSTVGGKPSDTYFYYDDLEKDVTVMTCTYEGEIRSDNCTNFSKFKATYDSLVAGKKIKEAQAAIIEALKNYPLSALRAPSPTRGEGDKLKSSFDAQSDSSTPSPLVGFERQENDLNGRFQREGARRADEGSLLIKQEKITRSVKCAERSGVPIEILVMPQWFVKILDKKAELKAKANECNWFPDYMRIRIEQWIDGLSWDWCISRQRFFGVKFPVWYSRRKGEEGKILVAEVDQLPCDPNVDLPRGYSRDEVTAETDIMDTWATSSISPQLSSHGISSEICFDKKRYEKLFPADLRPQAHEIIRTWAFYTIVKAYLHGLPSPLVGEGARRADEGSSIPWKNLMISGWCLAADKTKMSKSKGNVVTPTSLIEEKGSDIVRYWASTSHLGADTAYSEEVFKIGQKLITKLFNAAKFASMHFDILARDLARDLAQDGVSDPVLTFMHSLNEGMNVKTGSETPSCGSSVTESADLWILSKLHNTVKRATEEFEKFEYARAREAIEEFFWKDFCDNYLEICKVRSYGLAAEKLNGVDLNDAKKAEILREQQSAVITLRICLNAILKLFAPFIPHITDEIYSTIFAEEFAEEKSIHARGNWVKLSEIPFNQKHHDIGQAALDVIFEVRKFKSDNNLSMKTTVKNLAVTAPIDLTEISEDLANVCNAEKIEVRQGEFLVKIL